MSRPVIDFYYEFASPFSYLSAIRITALAEAAGVGVNWRPFLLGAVLKTAGQTRPLMETFPQKSRNQWRDAERLAEAAGLPPLTLPDPFPAASLLATRVAVMLNDASRPAFSRGVFTAEFAQGRDIGDPVTIRQVLAGLGHFYDGLLDEAQSEANKEKARAATEHALAAGVYGAPTFVTADGELFWGNDRLEAALDWARHKGTAPAE